MSLGNSLAQLTSIFVPINKYRDMRLIDLMREFPDEQSCERKLKEYREAQGITYHFTGDRKDLLITP